MVSSKPGGFYEQGRFPSIKILILVLLNSILHKANSGSNNSASNSLVPFPPHEILSSLQTLPLHGHFSLRDNEDAAKDFGNIHHFPPLAVLHPKTVSDISLTIKHVFEMGFASQLKIAARGHGHSLQGQAQVHGGLVINMESLQGPSSHCWGHSFKCWYKWASLQTAQGTEMLTFFMVFLEGLVNLASLQGLEFLLNQHLVALLSSALPNSSPLQHTGRVASPFWVTMGGIRGKKKGL